MAGPAVRIEGLSKVLRDLKKLGADINDLKPGMKKASSILGNSLRKETPRVSGRMASTIRPGTAARYASAKIGRNPTKFAYAPVLNYSSKSRHKGFVERALHGSKNRVLQVMEREVNQFINKAGF